MYVHQLPFFNVHDLEMSHLIKLLFVHVLINSCDASFFPTSYALKLYMVVFLCCMFTSL